MALKSNRVGVRTDQVDVYGRITSKSFLQSILDHLPRWTSLKVWKNGTEQLLPVNTDEPVTSPIVADIQYPTDSSATEQMFTYRKSPTDADGEAYIKSIKGNTIVWNQKLDDVDIASNITSKFGLTLTGLQDVCGINVQGTYEYTSGDRSIYVQAVGGSLPTIPIISGHKYFVSCTSKYVNIYCYGATFSGNYLNNTPHGGTIVNATTDGTFKFSLHCGSNIQNNTAINEDVFLNLFDLTAMFGSTKADEIYAMETAQAGSGVAYFRSLFPLPYYQYDAGSLLSFNGTGIKTVGKNLIDMDAWLTGVGATYTKDGNKYTITAQGNTYSQPFQLFGGVSKVISARAKVSTINGSVPRIDLLKNGTLVNSLTLGETSRKNIEIDSFRLNWSNFGSGIIIEDFQIEFGAIATEFEPYTTSTTSIPTDTYFPTGMKKAGTAYDEFTSSRAYTRVGSKTLDGSENWIKSVSYEGNYYYSAGNINAKLRTNTGGISSNGYERVYTTTALSANDKVWMIDGSTSSQNINIKNTDMATLEDFKSWLQANPITFYFELAEEIIEPTLEFDEE